jgi:hypothetical protein
MSLSWRRPIVRICGNTYCAPRKKTTVRLSARQSTAKAKDAMLKWATMSPALNQLGQLSIDAITTSASLRAE